MRSGSGALSTWGTNLAFHTISIVAAFSYIFNIAALFGCVLYRAGNCTFDHILSSAFENQTQIASAQNSLMSM